MEEINLRDLFSYYKSKILYIILVVIIITGFGFLYKRFLEKPKYESTTSLILVGFNQNEANSSIDNDELAINQKLVPTYQEIVKSDKVLSKVIKELKLDYKLEELAKNIKVSAVTDTEIIEITVSDTNPKRAYKIVSNIANVFSEEIQEIYNVSNVSILDKARINKQKSNLSLTKSIIIFIGVGIFLGVVIVTVYYYFDTTIKTSEQLESKFDISVLGSIPIFDNKKSKTKRGRK